MTAVLRRLHLASPLTQIDGGTHIDPVPIVIRPARVAFDPSGTPFSEHFGDVYHSAESGPDQARHVFVRGNDLPARWRGMRVFTIVETGFGLGLNFMATCAAWQSDPARCSRLHFVSIERHPFARPDLATLHARYTEFSDRSSGLCAAWPPVIAGTHRLNFEDGRITLTLVFANVLEALRDLRLGADAFYLDGFAPDRNPEMWSPPVMKALARLARSGATLATYTTARAVRDALASAGFAVEKSPGFGRKREMLIARFTPRWTTRHAPPARVEPPERTALIIGAGLAGAAVAERLASRGWEIDIVDRGVAAAGASGLYAGVLQPHLSRDDCILSRFTRAGFLYAHSRRASMSAYESGLARAPSGVLQIADDPAHEGRMADDVANLGYPTEYVQLLSQAAASSRAGGAVSSGGWWIPMGDWMRPGKVVRGLLAAAQAWAPGLRARYHHDVVALVRRGERWCAIDALGAEVASAAVAVLANAHDAVRLGDFALAPLQRVRGQLTLIPAPAGVPRTVLCGRGYVLPSIDGNIVAGASFDPDDDSMQRDDTSDAANLRRAERVLPGIGANADTRSLRSEVGMRCVARDRMPMAGPMVDTVRAREIAHALSGAHAADIPRVPGLFCAVAFASRGLAWTALSAECVASQIDGEPLPLEGSLIDAIDPARFAVKRARRGTL